MRRILSRGLNYHGQCGHGSDILNSSNEFKEIVFQMPIKNVYAGLAHSYALHEGVNFFN